MTNGEQPVNCCPLEIRSGSRERRFLNQENKKKLDKKICQMFFWPKENEEQRGWSYGKCAFGRFLRDLKPSLKMTIMIIFQTINLSSSSSTF